MRPLLEEKNKLKESLNESDRLIKGMVCRMALPTINLFHIDLERKLEEAAKKEVKVEVSSPVSSPKAEVEKPENTSPTKASSKSNAKAVVDALKGEVSRLKEELEKFASIVKGK